MDKKEFLIKFRELSSGLSGPDLVWLIMHLDLDLDDFPTETGLDFLCARLAHEAIRRNQKEGYLDTLEKFLGEIAK